MRVQRKAAELEPAEMVPNLRALDKVAKVWRRQMVAYGVILAVIGDVEQTESEAQLKGAPCNQSPGCGIFIRTQMDD